MKREEKQQIIESLKEEIQKYGHFYITDTSGLNAADTFLLRKECFKKDIKMIVVKNTLMQKALESIEGDYTELFATLKGSSSILLCEVGNVPGKMIKNFRKKFPKPLLKGAYVEQSVYVGENQLDALANIKSRDELIGDVIALLQSPMQRVLGSLQSGGHIIAGVVKTLQERE
ncbi:MAG: 50S ribosomal protein L10 [Salinivirgaceae bacterium]|nr:50S ribosomal protein L10 [Salinivirgaceae bacterium]MDD4746850.1 50S ribosomal protein L10 [Salinivirgaceae bacterium]MDY0280141.1 50S ribosomal protein L10 [Salinivirgaceae bacterium]